MDALSRTPVVTCFLERRGRILLLRRSDRVGTYRGRWAGVSGYVDRVPLEQALVEVTEEVGLGPEDVKVGGLGPPTCVDDEAEGRHWLVYPVVLTARPRAEVRLNWENAEARWIDPSELGDYETVPGLARVLRNVWPPFGNIRLWHAARKIAEDRESGATELATQALRALWAFARTYEARAPGAVLRTARALAALRPSMAVIAHVLARALAQPDAENGLAEELATAGTGCALMATRRLLGARRVVTYSASSVCERTLRWWSALRGGGEIIVAESRPKLEGVAVAQRLAAAGLSVRLVTDAQIGMALREADALLVGADAITDDDRILNKIGTETAVLMARELSTPAYAACQTHKIAPPGWPLGLERQDPTDVHPPTDFRVQNVAFDATPLNRFTGVLTEEGRLTRKLLARVRRELREANLTG